MLPMVRSLHKKILDITHALCEQNVVFPLLQDFLNHSAAMVAFPCSKPASPANCLNLLVAFGIATHNPFPRIRPPRPQRHARTFRPHILLLLQSNRALHNPPLPLPVTHNTNTSPLPLRLRHPHPSPRHLPNHSPQILPPILAQHDPPS